MRWRDLWDAQGEEGLKVRRASGRPPKMSGPQKDTLLKMLLQGPLAFGWRTDVWTTGRAAELIHKKFSIDYHFTQVARILHAHGWSPQKPERHALELNEAAIQRWKATDWERGEKTPRGWAPALIFNYESGFLLTPTMRRTGHRWAALR